MLFHLTVISEPPTEMGDKAPSTNTTALMPSEKENDNKETTCLDIADASSANENKNNNKGGCCCDCCKDKCSCCYSCWNFIWDSIQTCFKCIVGCVIVLVVIIIILAITLPLTLGKKDVKPTTTTTVVTTTHKPVTPTTPYPGQLILGEMLTTENYTMGLDDTSSPAFQTFEKNFTEAMQTFYESTNSSSVYDGVSIAQLRNNNRQVEISFEVRVRELDTQIRPNAYTVLEEQLQTNSLGKFRVISHSLTAPVDSFSRK